MEGAQYTQYTNISAPLSAIHALLERGDDEWFVSQARTETNWLMDIFGLAKGKKFLEIGPGWGRMLLAAKLLGMEPTGYELSTPNCELGKKLGLDMRNEDFCNSEVISEYDNIYLSHSLEHTQNPKKLLSLLYHYCAQDGNMFIAVPNFNSWWHECLGEKWPWLSPKDHLIHFTPKTLQMMIKNAGFNIKKCTTCMSYDPDFDNYKLVKEKFGYNDSHTIIKKLKQLEREGKGESIWIYAKK